MQRIDRKFFQRDVLEVAPDLLGQYIVRQFVNGEIKRFRITETEAYRNEEDLACHCSKGKTTRTQIMYENGGLVYVYLIYGMYWMLNFVCAYENTPQAVLIRACDEINGPGKLGKVLQLDKSFYGEDLGSSNRIWLEYGALENSSIIKSPRIGIDYAGEIWKNKDWRFSI